MATTSKLSFRARNLDANRGMKVFFADELPDISECAPIARGVNPMPTGMEKEEEMESHLQEAILAQQASTSGISDNHVIPTPKVLQVDAVRHNQTYPVQPPPKTQYIKVQAWLSMEREEAEYDMDSEDEEYLRDKPHINARDLERIIETLEAQSSESAICQPATARKVLMPHFDDCVIDDVYDYWLSKRKEAATSKSLGFGGLIPRIRTECRKENAVLNPYVAFRRRAEKMQTRKNRKNDEDSYEKVLKLGHDLRRAVHLFEMVKRREKSKLAMLDMDAEILSTRAQLGDFGSVVYNQILSKLNPEEERVPPPVPNASSDQPQPLREENGVRRTKMRKRTSVMRSGLGAAFDRELPNKAWLKKNAEVWNQSPAAFISGMTNFSPAVEIDQSVAAASTANADGRYQFKRRRGCQYRAPLPLKDKGRPSHESVPSERRFYHVSLPSTSSADAVPVEPSSSSETAPAAATRPTALLRRRIGRGGRVIFDRFVESASTLSRVPPRHGYIAGRTNALIYDPFELDCAAVGDAKSTPYQARARRSLESEDADESMDDEVISSRYLHSGRYRSNWSREEAEADAEAEAAWLASAVSPSPSPPPPAPSKRADVTRPDDTPGIGPSPPSEHEDDAPRVSGATPSTTLEMKAHLRGIVTGGSRSGYVNGKTPTAATVSHITPTPSMETPMECGSGASPEDSPTSSSGDDQSMLEHTSDGLPNHLHHHHDIHGRLLHTNGSNSHEEHHHLNNHLLPLGGSAAPVHHHHLHQHQLHLASGNAAVLSPPDSTAPSPRVSHGGCSNGGGGGGGANGGGVLTPTAASGAPTALCDASNGVMMSGKGSVQSAVSGNGLRTPRGTSEEDAWRVRTKLLNMEDVASRLARENKDPEQSSRESGCSPTDKVVLQPLVNGAGGAVDGVDGVVVGLVESWREPSNSPSESNSSSDWVPQNVIKVGDVDARLSVYATLSSEEESSARTGDHPTQPAKPTRKLNGSTTVSTNGSSTTSNGVVKQQPVVELPSLPNMPISRSFVLASAGAPSSIV